ncbi:MAG: Zn-dependent protease, partial [Deltaproteobacteria bacterium]|nr:Zn-dependent protease [Deltaproteobacteria bacterium]
MRRLLHVARAYRHMNAGDLAVEKNDVPAAEREYGAAMKLLPDSAEVVFWYAAALAMAGQIDRSLPLFARAYALDPSWRTLVPRLPASGLLPADPAVLSRIEGAGRPSPG